MAGYQFLNLYTDLETISNVTGQRAMVKRLVNNAIARIAAAWDWPFLWTLDAFESVATVTAGTVSITVGSASVTGTSTAFDSSMLNRKIRFGSESAYYIIVAQSGQTLTLNQNYQGTTNTAASYTIYKDEFLLRADADAYKLIRNAAQGVVLISKDVSELDWEIPSPSGLGPANFQVFTGRAVRTYTTGTLSGTSGSRILTGASSPSWNTVEGLTKGSKVQVGTSVFTVNTVDSATQLTVYEALGSAIASGTAYTAVLDNPIVQLYTIPNTAEIYYYRFQRFPAVLDADQDIPDLPHPLHPLIIKEGLIWLWEFKGFPDRQKAAEQDYLAGLQEAILHYGHSNPDRIYRRQDADRRFGVRFADFPSNYGVPFTL